ALIEIKIEDTNNHEPEFDRSNYDVIVARNLKANQSILQLRAYDKDCGHPYGEVCHYEVTNGAQKWFQVTDSGLLRSTVDMDTVKTDGNNFIVTVIAHDCGMRRSSVPAIITLEMEKSKNDEVFSPLGFISDERKKDCKLGFGNIVDKITYLSDQGALQLFPSAVTNLCDESDC
uniref:Cadherin domain-containing protein n=2 Tax=Romanomermis culicivorax TaxID=13658 RepID=A0A915JR27_ROMCU